MAKINLFGEIKREEGEEWRAEWKDMPEFVHDDMFPKQRIIMNFKTHADALEFGKLIKQNVTSDTDSLWYPKPTYSPLGVYKDEGDSVMTDMFGEGGKEEVKEAYDL